MNEPYNFYKNIKKARISADLTQEELEQRISNLEQIVVKLIKKTN